MLPSRLVFFTLGFFCLAAPAAAKPGVKELIKQLPAVQGDDQLRVIRALGRCGKSPAAAALLPLLDVRKDSPRRSTVIVEALGRLGERSAAEPLISAWDYLVNLRQQMDLTGQVQVLRRAVVEAMGALGGEGVVRALLEAVSDSDPAVVEGAARGLGRLRERKALDALAELAGRGGNVGQAACEALGQIGDAKGQAALERALSQENPLDQAPAAYGLALMGRKDGVVKLEALLRPSLAESAAGVMAAYYLAKLGRKSGLDYLAGLLETEGAGRQSQAAEALGKSGSARAVQPLIKALDRSEPPLKLAVISGLGRLGGPRAAAALKKLRNDPILAVRNAAALALDDLAED